MKRYTITAAAILGVALSTGACDKGLADVNDNPNAPTDVPAQYLLPNAIQQTVEFGGQNTWITLEMTGIFVQHWAKIQYTEEDQYELRDAIINNLWNGVYAGPLKDWAVVIKKGQQTAEEGDQAKGDNQSAMGMVGKAYTASILTDLYGDIPYSQALQADAEEPITTPVYDPQQELYGQLLNELQTAVGMMNPGAGSFSDADLFYGGDMSQWIKFANSLRLRLAMRMSDVDPAGARSIVEAVASQPLILTNDDNAGLVYQASPPYQNPYYENAAGSLGGGGSRDDHAVSNTLVGILDMYNDPRIEVYANPASDQTTDFTASWCGGAGQLPCQVTYNGFVYRGERNGIANGSVPKLSLISRIGRHFRADPATPQYIMTAAEVNFLLAEAALNGWSVGGSAADYYEAGIRQAFELWNGVTVASTDAPVDLGTAVQDAYLAQPTVALTGNATTDLEKIIDQKWLALYTMPWEAYSEYRRTGYPDEIVPSEDATIQFIPGRIPYPSLEQSLNNGNLQAAISEQNTDGNYCGTVWWDPSPYPGGGC